MDPKMPKIDEHPLRDIEELSWEWDILETKIKVLKIRIETATNPAFNRYDEIPELLEVLREINNVLHPVVPDIPFMLQGYVKKYRRFRKL